MVTITRNPIIFLVFKLKTLVPNIGTLVVMILALWYFQDRSCPDCICYDRPCPELSCPPMLSYDVCMVRKSYGIVIQPCYMGGLNISHVRKIDRDFLDSKYVDRNSTLVITVPVNIQFDNSYSRVVFSGYARQYYFPNINERFSYVVSEVPIDYIKHLTQNNATGCVYEKYYYVNYDQYESSYHNNACILRS